MTCKGGETRMVALDQLTRERLGKCPLCEKMLPLVAGSTIVAPHPEHLYGRRVLPGSIRQ